MGWRCFVFFGAWHWLVYVFFFGFVRVFFQIKFFLKKKMFVFFKGLLILCFFLWVLDFLLVLLGFLRFCKVFPKVFLGVRVFFNVG